MTCVAFKPDNPNIVVSSSYDETIKTWDITSGSCLSTLKVGGDVPSIDFAPCGNKFAIACNNYNSSSYSVQIFSQDGSTGNFACQLTLMAASSQPAMVISFRQALSGSITQQRGTPSDHP